MKTYSNFINGDWVPAKSGQTFQNSNPADTREIVAQYPLSGREDAVAAIDASKAAFGQWSGTTPVARGRVLSKASQILEPRKAELAELLTREEGKVLVLADSQGKEIRVEIDEIDKDTRKHSPISPMPANVRWLSGSSSITWAEVCAHADGLLALWGGDHSLLVRGPFHGEDRNLVMRFLLKLMANLTDPHGGDATDRIVNALSRLAPSA
jgi:hypothetical protein